MIREKCWSCKGEGHFFEANNKSYKCHICKGDGYLEKRYQNAHSQGEALQWEPHEIELLKRLYQSRNVTFSEICERLSRSRGSVAGKAKKLGLSRPQKIKEKSS